MEMMTVDDLGEIMLREFSRIHEKFESIDVRFDAMDVRFDTIDARFDRLEDRVAGVEGVLEDHTGRLITIEDQLSHMTYTLSEADPRELKRRVERLELKKLG